MAMQGSDDRRSKVSAADRFDDEGGAEPFGLALENFQIGQHEGRHIGTSGFSPEDEVQTVVFPEPQLGDEEIGRLHVQECFRVREVVQNCHTEFRRGKAQRERGNVCRVRHDEDSRKLERAATLSSVRIHQPPHPGLEVPRWIPISLRCR